MWSPCGTEFWCWSNKPRTNYSSIPNGSREASENIVWMLLCHIVHYFLAHQPRSNSAITNPQLNRRSLTVCCKSFTVSKDKCKINPLRTVQFKKYIMKQLARNVGEQKESAHGQLYLGWVFTLRLFCVQWGSHRKVRLIKCTGEVIIDKRILKVNLKKIFSSRKDEVERENSYESHFWNSQRNLIIVCGLDNSNVSMF